MRRLLLGAILAASMTGCGTLRGAYITSTLHPMSGVKWDVKFVTCQDNYTSFPVNLLYILDFPFSFLYDVFLLPATIAVDADNPMTR